MWEKNINLRDYLNKTVRILELILHGVYGIHFNWASAWDSQQCGMYAQSDQSLCLSLEYFMIVKLLTEYHLECLSLKGDCRGLSDSHLSKCQIVGNLMHWLNFVVQVLTKLTKAQHPHLSYFFKHFRPDLKYKCSNDNNNNPNNTPTANKMKALIKFNIPILFCDLSRFSFLAWQAPDCQNDWSLSISPLYWRSKRISSISSFKGEFRLRPTP